VQGSYLTRDFLNDGIADTDAWKSLDPAELQAFRTAAGGAFAGFNVAGQPNEATTEDAIIVPVLKALGWNEYLKQQAAGGRSEDVPDLLLFASAAEKKAADDEKKSARRFRHGLLIVESKAWRVTLDRVSAADLFSYNPAAPSSQMLRYLTRVDVESNGAIQWGILTNGRQWRLYYQGARSRAEDFLEFDLPVLLEISGVQPDLFSPASAVEREHRLKAFYLLFRRAAFLPSIGDARTFHRIALGRAREFEAKISGDLSETVFARVYPELLQAIVDSDPRAPRTLNDGYLGEVRHAALILLYRLLFVLYAEDRNLLPAHDKGYDDYSLAQIRRELRDRFDRADAFSTKADTIYGRLKTIFRLIDQGDSAIGLPPYNGGLFDHGNAPMLDRLRISDDRVARILENLSRRDEGGGRKWINYRDLSVQHLGSIYERLLEFGVAAQARRVSTTLHPYARKGSGSYYTHEDLVRLILERAIRPLIDERREAFTALAAKLKGEKSRIGDRIERLRAADPAAAILELRICDPAMGSGHFLVSLVDYLADAVLEALDAAAEDARWTGGKYTSPVADRLQAIRERILAAATKEKWIVPAERLDDRHLVRRMILKRTIYGVDKNPMAVELAKLSLWLHTFTVGAPLSFLDHHLRCGDSLFGERVGHATITARGTLLINSSIQQAKNAAKGMASVELAPDADLAEVKASSQAFADIDGATRQLAAYLDFIHALRWLSPLPADEQKAADELLDGQHGDVVRVVSGAAKPKSAQASELLARAADLSHRERFLHWEAAFPGVWDNWQSQSPTGGFDAVIGNPPWDRIKLQEVEWFATRRPVIAKAQRAADRKKMVADLKKNKDPLWQEYEAARERAERMAAVARSGGYYPLLSGGDVNIYSLFVERARSLIRPEGIVGLLVPSGMITDLSASKFFRSLANAGGVHTILDFENRGQNYFPDVHPQFRFCVFVFGGTDRKAATTNCAFLLQNVDSIDSKLFYLTREDFARVNPNTGTAPMFRNRRDADIVLGIYSRLPPLVRHVPAGREAVWPVDYFTMYHMTNDSALFRTEAELQKDGFYPVAGMRMRRGAETFVPLMVGKTIHQFDHRSASADVNPAALHVAASSDYTTPAQHADPNFAPKPQFWVSEAEVRKLWPQGIEWAIGFRDITNATNARTVIATVVPFAACGNTLPILLPVQGSKNAADAAAYRKFAPLLLANLNSLALDYIARQKVQGTHLNWYIAEQLPVVPDKSYGRNFGAMPARDLVRREVLRLVYTSHDLAPFARDQGYDGAPFAWDEEDRRHRRARLDALFFHLYGLDANDADYVLDTFPIVKEQDEKNFGGRYRTKELVLAYMKALAAGDVDSVVAL
jgi:hypothetical protein